MAQSFSHKQARAQPPMPPMKALSPAPMLGPTAATASPSPTKASPSPTKASKGKSTPRAGTPRSGSPKKKSASKTKAAAAKSKPKDARAAASEALAAASADATNRGILLGWPPTLAEFHVRLDPLVRTAAHGSVAPNEAQAAELLLRAAERVLIEGAELERLAVERRRGIAEQVAADAIQRAVDPAGYARDAAARAAHRAADAVDVSDAEGAVGLAGLSSRVFKLIDVDASGGISLAAVVRFVQSLAERHGKGGYWITTSLGALAEELFDGLEGGAEGTCTEEEWARLEDLSGFEVQPPPDELAKLRKALLGALADRGAGEELKKRKKRLPTPR